MRAARNLRAGLVVLIVGTALTISVAGAFADSIRTRFVFGPRENAAQDVLRQVADREKSLYAANGSFVAFSNADIEKNDSLLGLPWSTFPVKDYFFDVTRLESGNIRLRALPRPDSVVALSIRARLYVAELSAKGDLVHSGWYPVAD